MIRVICLLLLALYLVTGSKLCPHHCLCYENSDLVDCRARGFTVFPHGIPHGTWLLDLSENRLYELKSSTFTGIWALRILLLQNNAIQAMQPQALASLSFLEKLDLSHNDLRFLVQDFTYGLAALKDLRLAHNSLEFLETRSFAHLESLEKLDMSHNHIRIIQCGAFHGLTSLKQLNLAWNQLSMLQSGLLTMQQKLSVLLLGHNNISSIETEVFTPLHSLSVLGLEANQLGSLKFRTFLNLQTPSTHVQLSENPWVCDCELHRVFSKILHVRRLHIDDYWNITCHTPPLLAGASPALMDSQLCIAETATVLVITATVMVTVVAAIAMAERNRRKKRLNLSKQGSESETALNK
ncbi:insulin-like growth factor-binding protein complex acid labile subunit [Astyanax mexicanus]|uniref:insulin-like growth factor-binding protein complex acid labile subunit n=1 Tax=Astyanax mexicanus TaxID=7994 RepID=UPI0020CAA8CA|nr:insulin-like growth factor-binding protein complex acid labile subunit [Astyanax mexicanus]